MVCEGSLPDPEVGGGGDDDRSWIFGIRYSSFQFRVSNIEYPLELPRELEEGGGLAPCADETDDAGERGRCIEPQGAQEVHGWDCNAKG